MSEVNNVTLRGNRITVEISDEIELDLSDILSEADAGEILDNLDQDDVISKAIEYGVAEIVNDMREDDKVDTFKALLEHLSTEEAIGAVRDVAGKSEEFSKAFAPAAAPEVTFVDNTLYTQVMFEGNLRGVIVGAALRLTREDGSHFGQECLTETAARLMAAALLKGRF